jgi:hypothetical protein
MDNKEPIPFHKLSREVQDAIDGQVTRIKSSFGIQHEMLSLEDLAKLLGKEVNYLWNLRNRGTMLPIPARRVGGQDTYWIVHVVLWMMNGCAYPSFPESEPSDIQLPADNVEVDQAAKEAKAVRKGAAPSGKGRRPQTSLAKEVLLARGMEILEQRQKAKNK